MKFQTLIPDLNKAILQSMSKHVTSRNGSLVKTTY